MMKSHFEEITAAPCVHSGFCCKQAPCPYGAKEENSAACIYLVEREKNRFYCGKYDEIKDLPGADIVPAFGAGCCSSLFNEAREKILKEVEHNANVF